MYDNTKRPHRSLLSDINKYVIKQNKWFNKKKNIKIKDIRYPDTSKHKTKLIKNPDLSSMEDSRSWLAIEINKKKGGNVKENRQKREVRKYIKNSEEI